MALCVPSRCRFQYIPWQVTFATHLLHGTYLLTEELRPALGRKDTSSICYTGHATREFRLQDRAGTCKVKDIVQEGARVVVVSSGGVPHGRYVLFVFCCPCRFAYFISAMWHLAIGVGI